MNPNTPTLLVVDDDITMLRGTVRVLNRSGFTPFMANRGLEALEIMATHHPNLVLLDWDMPEMDGIEVCRRIKANPEFEETLVIMLSGTYTQKEDQMTSLEEGADGFIVRPISNKELIVRMKAFSRIWHLNHKVRQKNIALEAAKRQVDELLQEANQTKVRLLAAQEQAHQANQAKSNFLANMSHEIRTPLSGILGMAQLLMLSNIEDNKRHHYAEVIFNSGKTLLDLLNDILHLSKIESGNIQLQSIIWHPQGLLDEIVTLFQQSAKSKLLQLSYDCSEVADYYLGDPYRLRQMLSNLVSNAINFTSQGHIRIVVSEIKRNEQTATIEFSVTDTGIGVDPSVQQTIFNPFTQADNAITQNFGGTGLGLSIVRKLAQAMGGNAGCESTLGQGSRFWFRINTNISMENTPSSHIKNSLISNIDKFSGQALIVEDNSANRQVLQAMLEQLGLTTKCVFDGQQALGTITTGTKANIIFMDIQMPGIDGCTTTQRIRDWEQTTDTPRCPIIALTALVFEQNKQDCLDAGMDGFLAKPILFDDLKTTLRQWLHSDPLAPTDSNMISPIALDVP